MPNNNGRRHRWTDEERDIVRVYYRQNNKSAQEIASRLGVSLFAVKGQVQMLGLAKRTGRKSWDLEQDDQLRELIARHTPSVIARVMGRSINSVVVRSKRLGLSRRSRDGWYTKQEVCEIFGVDHKRVQSWIDQGILSASYHHGHRPSNIGAACWHIERKNIARFIRKYSQELTGRNVDLIQMVEILVGLEVC